MHSLRREERSVLRCSGVLPAALSVAEPFHFWPFYAHHVREFDFTSKGPRRGVASLLIAAGRSQGLLSGPPGFHGVICPCLSPPQDAPAGEPHPVPARGRRLQQPPGQAAPAGARAKRQHRTRYPSRAPAQSLASRHPSLYMPSVNRIIFWLHAV